MENELIIKEILELLSDEQLQEVYQLAVNNASQTRLLALIDDEFAARNDE